MILCRSLRLLLWTSVNRIPARGAGLQVLALCDGLLSLRRLYAVVRNTLGIHGSFDDSKILLATYCGVPHLIPLSSRVVVVSKRVQSFARMRKTSLCLLLANQRSFLVRCRRRTKDIQVLMPLLILVHTEHDVVVKPVASYHTWSSHVNT